jgi:hypothetical protein
MFRAIRRLDSAYIIAIHVWKDMGTEIDLLGKMFHDLILRFEHSAFFRSIGDLQYETFTFICLKEEILVSFAGQGFGGGVQGVEVIRELDRICDTKSWGVV